MSSLRNYLFSDYLEDGEEIVFVCHKHVIVLIRDFFWIVALHLGLSAFAWYFFPTLLWACLIWVGIGIVRFLLVLQDWYYDCWLVTNMGIVGVLWAGFFNRSSTRVEYASVEGVSYTINGIIPTILNYGTVTLAKLGGPSTVALKDAYNPKKIERNILTFQEEFLTTKNFKDQEFLKQLLTDLVVEHVKKNGLPLNAFNKENNKPSLKKK
jgi:hypothetical protein